jgi:hypothetical protein
MRNDDAQLQEDWLMPIVAGERAGSGMPRFGNCIRPYCPMISVIRLCGWALGVGYAAPVYATL